MFPTFSIAFAYRNGALSRLSHLKRTVLVCESVQNIVRLSDRKFIYNSL
jgi:hypothetical protein